jgi:(E)-4-hydroxy-3-methylbut-2-enyl-diphosphate synthase
MDSVVAEVQKRIAAYDDPIEISVLSTAVYGIGEAREFDLGITSANETGLIYAKGRPLKAVAVTQLVEDLFEEVDKYYAAGKKIVIDDAQAAEAVRWLSETEDRGTF